MEQGNPDKNQRSFLIYITRSTFFFSPEISVPFLHTDLMQENLSYSPAPSHHFFFFTVYPFRLCLCTISQPDRESLDQA